jgi:uncharacterized membrane protein
MARGKVGPSSLKARRALHRLFELGILIKGIDGSLELIGGLLLLFLSPTAISGVLFFFVQGELKEDPTDLVANLLVHATRNVIQVKLSASTFLMVHGAVKLLLVGGLVAKKLWSYPAAIVVFAAFTVYQIYQLGQLYSLFLVTVTVLDIIVIVLVIAEYRYVRRAGKREL